MISYLAVWFALVGSVGASMSSLQPGAGPSTEMLGPMGVGVIFMGLFWLAIIIPTIALQVRRIHELDRSGWWIGGHQYLAYMVMAFGTVLGTAGTADPSQVHPTGLVGTMIIVLAFSIYSIVLLVFSAPAERRDEPLRA